MRVEINEQLVRLNTLRTFDPDETYYNWQKFVKYPNLGNFVFKFLESVIH